MSNDYARMIASWGPPRSREFARNFRNARNLLSATLGFAGMNMPSPMSVFRQIGRSFRGRSTIPKRLKVRMPRRTRYRSRRSTRSTRSRRGRRTRTRTRTRRRVRARTSTRSKLASKISALTKKVNGDLATHTRRTVLSPVIDLTVKNQGYMDHLNACDIAKLDDAISQLRYYDPSNPSVLLTAGGATGDFSRTFTFLNFSAKLVIRNNYNTPFFITLYVVTPKSDLTFDPVQHVQEGLDIQMAVPADVDAVTSYPTDSDVFNTYWKIRKTVKRYLTPGKETAITYNTGRFEFNPEVADIRSLETYMVKYKSAVFMWKVQTSPAHDSVVPDTVGLAPAKFDATLYFTSKVQYDAGVALNDFSSNISLDEMGFEIINNGPMTGNQLFDLAKTGIPL